MRRRRYRTWHTGDQGDGPANKQAGYRQFRAWHRRRHSQPSVFRQGRSERQRRRLLCPAVQMLLSVSEQVIDFLWATASGMAIAFIYDLFRIFRKAVKTGSIAVF